MKIIKSKRILRLLFYKNFFFCKGYVKFTKPSFFIRNIAHFNSKICAYVAKIGVTYAHMYDFFIHMRIQNIY